MNQLTIYREQTQKAVRGASELRAQRSNLSAMLLQFKYFKSDSVNCFKSGSTMDFVYCCFGTQTTHLHCLFSFR